VHAAYEAGKHLTDNNPEIDSTVLCRVKNEEDLLRAQARIESRGIKTILFREPDIGDQATALATEPIFGNRRKALSRYQLWED